MDQHDDSQSGFIPDAYNRPKAVAVLTRGGRWRIPAVATTMALVAALCLNTGSAAHATTASAAKPAGVSAARTARSTPVPTPR